MVNTRWLTFFLISNQESRPLGANLPALGLSNKAVFEGNIVIFASHSCYSYANSTLPGDISTQVDEEDDTATLQSYAHPSATPTSLSQSLEHPPFEEHLMQHTLWPEVEKL
jgi:elongator complex protein 2